MMLYKMMMILGAVYCLSFTLGHGLTNDVMGTRFSDSDEELGGFEDYEPDYSKDVDMIEEAENHDEHKRIAEIATLANRYENKRQKGSAGLWGRRQLSEKPTNDDMKSEMEWLRRAVVRLTLLKTRDLAEKVLRPAQSKREQHGSTGLWGKRHTHDQVKRESDRTASVLKKRGAVKKQPDETGLWGKRRSTKKNQPGSPTGDKKRGAYKDEFSRSPNGGLWARKSARDPTRGPSENENLGLWGREQNGKAGLWGRKRSLANRKIF